MAVPAWLLAGCHVIFEQEKTPGTKTSCRRERSRLNSQIRTPSTNCNSTSTYLPDEGSELQKLSSTEVKFGFWSQTEPGYPYTW